MFKLDLGLKLRLGKVGDDWVAIETQLGPRIWVFVSLGIVAATIQSRIQ